MTQFEDSQHVDPLVGYKTNSRHIEVNKMEETEDKRSSIWYSVPEGSSERAKSRKKRLVDGSRNTIYTNPCFYEGQKSLKCKLAGEEDCTQYFENYRQCRKFWTKIEKDRKRKGIEPNIPPPDQREQIRQEYMNR